MCLVNSKTFKLPLPLHWVTIVSTMVLVCLTKMFQESITLHFKNRAFLSLVLEPERENPCKVLLHMQDDGEADEEQLLMEMESLIIRMMDILKAQKNLNSYILNYKDRSADSGIPPG